MPETGCDMIVSLMNLPAFPSLEPRVRIKRAFCGDKGRIMDFVRLHFSENWAFEAEKAILSEPSKCFIATIDGALAGFACYDSSARGFFGPIGVAPNQRGLNIGAALLLRALEAMREFGYGYAVIGWVSDAAEFYKKTVGAEFIKGGEPEHSVYSQLIYMR